MNSHGTDPTSADTDNDGLNDFAEVTEYNTDPLFAQSDRDKLSDGEEVHTHGTDPTDPDTDGDGLTDYQEVTSEPVTIDTGFERTFTSDPLVKDMDGDGATDYDEITHRTNLTNPDIDGDSLTDGFEISHRSTEFGPDNTDPHNPDTNKDGHSDYYEATPVSELKFSTDRIHLNKPFDTTDFSGRDSDGDGFPDRLEQQNSNLSVDTKDVVVRVIWTENQAPMAASLLNIVDAYANSPVDDNSGIRLHFYIDEQIDRPATGSSDEFSPDAQNEVTVTGSGMHNAVYVKNVSSNDQGVSGVASVNYPGFFVGSAKTPHRRGTVTMHELGHSLGLISNFDGIDSSKYEVKDYPSVMNYNILCPSYHTNCYIYSSGTGHNDWAAIERLLENGETTPTD